MRGMCHGPILSHLPSKGHIQVEGHQGPDITRKPVFDKKKYILAMGPALLCNNQSGLAWLGGPLGNPLVSSLVNGPHKNNEVCHEKQVSR